MYADVGCNTCGALWLLSDPDSSTTAGCQRCGKTHQVQKLKRFFESDDRNAAREARAALLAKKHGDSAAFADVAHVADLEARLDESGIDDETFLTGVGLDPDAIAAAGEVGSGGSKSRDEIVREAVERAGDTGGSGDGDSEDDRPTEGEIVAYAVDRDVPAETARTLLERLRQRGEVSEQDGRYRLV